MRGHARCAVTMGAGALLGTALAIACAPRTFACGASTDCIAGDVLGTCEADGWCSFPDETCASGSRYGDYSGDGLAGECVGPASASTSSDSGPGTTASSLDATTASTTTSTSATAVTTDESEASSSTADTGVSGCGDGVPDPGEPCDDGNEIPGDGCNPGCVPSGEPVWIETVTGEGNGFDGAFTIERFADGDLAVGIALATGEVSMPQVLRLDPDGGTVWTWGLAQELTWTQAYTWGLDIDEIGELGLAVSATGIGPDGNETAVALVDADGNTRWSALAAAAGFGIAIDAEGALWSAGAAAGEGVFHHYSAEGELLDTFVGEPYSPADGHPFEVLHDGGTRLFATGRYDSLVDTPAYFGTLGEDAPRIDVQLGTYNEGLAIAYDPLAQLAWVVGYAEDDDEQGQGWVAAFGERDMVVPPQVVTEHAQANLHGVAIDPSGAIVAVGWQSPNGDRDRTAIKVGPDGTVIWSRIYAADGADVLRDVVIAPDGAIFVVGEITGQDGSNDGWIARLAP